MARNIYSFIKIEKRQTKRGIYASAFGIASLICMAVLTIASFVKAGNLPAFVGGIGYLSLLAAVLDSGCLFSSARITKLMVRWCMALFILIWRLL